MAFTSRHYLLMFTIIFLWAGNIIAIKYSVMELPPLTAVALRFMLASLVFIPFIRLPGREQLFGIFQVAIFMNVLHLGLMFVALKFLDAATVAVLLQTQVIFATLLGWFVFKEKIGWRTWTGIAVAIAGVGVMIGEPNLLENPIGIALMLCSTLALAFGYVRMKNLKKVHAATYVGLMSVFSVPLLLLGSLVFESGSWSAVPDANWIGVLGPVYAYQAFVISLTHIGWQRLLHIGDVGRISAFSLLIPFIAVLLSVVLLGETLSWQVLTGGLMTMAGVGIITLRRLQKGTIAKVPAAPL